MCGSGKRRSQAAGILTDRGYTAVNVAGGITEWYRAGHPVAYTQTHENRPTPATDRAASGLLPLLSRLFRRKNT